MALSYYRSKPLVMVSLTDLVNMDMLMVIFATGCFILTPYTIAHLGLRLPPLAALCLVDALKFCASSVVMYLVVGAVVPYIYLRRKRASLSEDRRAGPGRDKGRGVLPESSPDGVERGL